MRSSIVPMATNTVMHRLMFERLVNSADGRSGEGEDVVHAILMAALAVARRRMGAGAASMAICGEVSRWSRDTLT